MLIQLSLQGLPIHRWITEFTRRHVELNLNVFTIAMISLSVGCFAISENKSSVAKSKTTDVVPHSLWSFEKKKSSGDPLVELQLTLDSIGG